VTDSPISPVGQLADVILLAVSAGTGMQNSMVAPMAVANALLNGVATSRGTSALERTAAMTV
jgi:DNA-binding MurR/RpiR family transcriptional regulator